MSTNERVLEGLPELPEPETWLCHCNWHEESGYSEDQMREYARAAIAALNPWQPIETAPKDTPCLLYGAKRSEMVVGMLHPRDGWVIDTPSAWVCMYPPTHWMPLPSPPAQESANG